MVEFQPMTMTAFITINSGSISLIEGVYALKSCILDWRFSVVWVHIFCFSFSKEKICWRKKHLVQDLIPPPSIYIHICTLYTHTNVYMPKFSPFGFFGPSRCLIPTPGLTTEYPIFAVCVCVCVYTHVHPHTLPPVLRIEKTQTTPLSFLLSKNNPPRQAISALTD